jgi:hypothetical protein
MGEATASSNRVRIAGVIVDEKNCRHKPPLISTRSRETMR